jgi:bla regulator protein blaR1
MTLADLGVMLEHFAPALKNHLWQSTLFASGAAALTLALRKNQARTRYWVWLSASLKFLVPFAPLVTMGSLLATPHRSSVPQNPVYFVMDEVSQPFTHMVVQQVNPIASISTHSLWSLHLPLLVAAIWAAGCFVVVIAWLASWRRIWMVLRDSTPVTEAREWRALREVENASGISAQIQIVSTPSALGPAVYGIHRPVLIWPSNVSSRLEDAQLQSIVAHELCHVRRRDNLTAALHMVVQAIFWFHPLVWWLGLRLEMERERACDEDVLAFTDQPYTYAESILKVCEYCVESPLPCISGVTGADLQRRIQQIMTGRAVAKLSLSRKVLFAAAGIAAVLVPILSGQVAQDHSQAALPASGPSPSSVSAVAKNDPDAVGTPQPRFKAFEVATIKPVASEAKASRFITLQGVNRFVVKDYTLRLLIAAAYNLNPKAISGGPDWIDSDHYDILALSPGNVRPTHDEQMTMLRSLLTDRYRLTFHLEQKEFSIYVLEVAKNGAKLKVSPLSADAPPVVGPGVVYPQRIVLPARNATMGDFVSLLQRAILDRPVVDSTGLSGRYDFDLAWAPDETQFGGEVPPASGDAPSPPLFEALQQQLGLKLEARKGLAPALAIDEVSKPSGN